MSDRPTVFLFEIAGSFEVQKGRRYNLNVWGFFSAAGALAFVKTRWRPASCWISSAAPPGWIQVGRDGSRGKVYRRG